MAGLILTVKATYKEKRIEMLSLYIIQMLPVRTVHPKLYFHPLDEIATIFGCHAVVLPE